MTRNLIARLLLIAFVIAVVLHARSAAAEDEGPSEELKKKALMWAYVQNGMSMDSRGYTYDYTKVVHVAVEPVVVAPPAETSVHPKTKKKSR